MSQSTIDLDSLIAERRPGWTLARPFYTDPSVFRIDLDRIFLGYWLFAGHTCQIPDVGDYFTYAIDNESIIVIRGDDGQVRALFNVCRHRGSRICTTPSGNAKRLVCPYHQWAYNTRGELKSARGAAADFDLSRFGLHRAHVRVLEGLIFVSLADVAPDFDPVEADVRSHLEPYDFARVRIAHTASWEARANWKLIVENSRECCHCPGGHHEYSRVVALATADESPRRQAEYAALVAERRSAWRKLGLETREVAFQPDRWHHVSRFPLRNGCVSETLDGRQAAPLLGRLADADAGVLGVVMYPGFWFEASSDYAFTMRQTPLGPAATRIDLNWYVREDAVEGVDFEVEKITAVWKATAAQDRKLCEDNQAGVESGRYRPGPYLGVEAELEKFIQWYLDQLAMAVSTHA